MNKRVGVLLVSMVGLLWAAPLSVETLQGRVQEAIQTAIGDKVDHIEVDFRPLPKLVNWPNAETPLKILVPERPFGLFIVPVEWVDQGRHFQIPVQVSVVASDKVLISIRAFDRLTEIGDKDLKREDRDVTSVLASGKTLLRQSGELFGKRTRAYVKQGDLLTLDLLEPKPDIFKGQSVTLVSTQGAIEVSLSAIAEQDGKIGEIISVKKNDKSKVSMKVRVESATTVRAER